MKLLPVKKTMISNTLAIVGAVPDTETREIISPPSSQKELTSSVTLSTGMTENMGDYRSVKIMVAVTLPCENSSIARRDAIELASAELFYYLEAEMPRAKERFAIICGDSQ